MTDWQYDEFEVRVRPAGGGAAPAPAGPAAPAPVGEERHVRSVVPVSSTETATLAVPRGEYEVEAQTWAGECPDPSRGEGTFRVPFTPAEWTDLVTRGPRLDPKAIAGLGARLYQAVFAGPVGELYAVANATAAANAGRGLRLRFFVEPPELAELPWEIVRNPVWEVALAQADRTPVVRGVDAFAAAAPLKVEGPLRVLLVAASPSGHRPIDVTKDLEKIAAALEPLRAAGRVETTVLTGATKKNVVEAVRDGAHHVAHFATHGNFDPARGGLLALEGGDLTAEEFRLAVAGNPGLRLVVLNACRTGDDDPAGTGRGLAASAVRLNVPAVIGMQYPVTDGAAVAFAAELYLRLAAGRPVDQAVALARAAVRFSSSPADAGDWLTPVLYLRPRNGRLFQLPGLHHLDFTPDAKAAAATRRALEAKPAPPPTAAGPADLTVALRGLGGGRFAVRLTTPAGATDGETALPDWLTGPLVRPVRPGAETDRRVPVSDESLVGLGEELFGLLFPGPLAEAYRNAYAAARKTGLRLTVEANDPQVDVVPWELIRDPATGRYPAAVGARAAFARRLTGIPAPPLDPVDGPVRILFVMSDRRDRRPLNLEREWDWACEAVRDLPPGRVVLDPLRDPTPEVLVRTLDRGGYHVFHFVGFDAYAATDLRHGGRDEGVVLADEQMNPLVVQRGELATLLGDVPSLRLVVTNTCYTAARLAPALVRAGVPAAVGMRFLVLDDVAARFTLLFYQALAAQNWAVVPALAEARRLLLTTTCSSHVGQWGYPTLYTTEPGGEVFGPAAP